MAMTDAEHFIHRWLGALANAYRPDGLRDNWTGPSLPFCEETRRTTDNAGWRWQMLMWNWHRHSLDGFPGWDMVGHGWRAHPPFVKLEHARGADGSAVESRELRNGWDDIAGAAFYSRDWTDDGIPFVREGERYWSGWWFETQAECDRFRAWHNAHECPEVE